MELRVFSSAQTPVMPAELNMSVFSFVGGA